MNIYLYIKQAFSALKSNKLRSFLSALWIIIWILSFVIMLAFWEWAKKSILDSFWSEWNIIRVYQYSEKPWAWNSWKNIFTEEVLEEIVKKVPNTIWALWSYSPPNEQLVYKTKTVSWEVATVWKNFFELKKVKTILWTTFWEDDFEKKSKIMIIWYKLVRSTFWKENPIWKKVDFWWEQFTISWVLEEKWWDYDNKIIIPNTTSKEYFWRDNIVQMEVFAKDDNSIEGVIKNLKYFLQKKSWLDDYSKVWFTIKTNKELLKQVWEFQQMFSYFLIWIWSISLIVWWIWIMNIMLVSVTERTREVWIRKAIWATNFSIMLQFLIESIILTLVWSFIAILLLYWLTALINSYIKEALQMEIYISFKVLLIAISVSISMWVIFWIMPAYKAARLKPIEALHFE